jgi:cyclin B
MGMPSPSYMERQVQVNAKMRAILVDWLVDVHKKYKLRVETLFLAVSLIDRYLDLQVTLQKHLQLVGVTALLVAAKFEEVYPPAIKDFVYVTDKAYSREDILQMEVSMLRVLQFKICRPTAVHFIERYQLVNGCTDTHRDLAQYLLELTLADYKMIKYAPSHLAAAAILLSNKLLGRHAWTPALVRHTRFTESMLRECAKEMCYDLEMAEQSQLQAVRKKYSQQKYHSVAKLNFMTSAAERGNSAATTSRRMSTGCRRSSSGVPMDIA